MQASVLFGVVPSWTTVLREHRYPTGEWAVLGMQADGIPSIALDDRTHGVILVEWPEGREDLAEAYWQGMRDAR